MRLLVTQKPMRFGEYLIVPNLKSLVELSVSYSDVVISDFPEDSVEAVKCVNTLSGKGKRVVYISDVPNEAVKMAILATGGTFFSDTYYLDDPEDITDLLDNLTESKALELSSAKEVVLGFLDNTLKQENGNLNSNYIMVVREATDELVKRYDDAVEEAVRISQTGNSLFTKFQKDIESINDENRGFKDQIKEIQEQLEHISNNSVSSSFAGGNISFFSPVSYLKDKDIIRIKDIGGTTTYLVSFCIGLLRYAVNMENIKAKMIVVTPTGGYNTKRYKQFTWVDSSNFRDSTIYQKDVVFTNYPVKTVIEEWLNDIYAEIFIVVDRTLTGSDHILRTRKPYPYYCASSKGVLEGFNCAGKDYFTSPREDGGIFYIPTYKGYPEDELSRQNIYLSHMSNNYKRLLREVK